jgi:hypothetical protein
VIDPIALYARLSTRPPMADWKEVVRVLFGLDPNQEGERTYERSRHLLSGGRYLPWAGKPGLQHGREKRRAGPEPALSEPTALPHAGITATIFKLLGSTMTTSSSMTK